MICLSRRPWRRAVGGHAYHDDVPELVPNLRDVGGVPASEGTVRTGSLLRSALPAADDLAPDGLTWPPSLVVDLRSAPEAEPVHPLEPAGARVLNLPLLSALRPGVAPPSTLADLYLTVVHGAAPLLVDLVREVSDEPGATLVHCAAGKDRTGISIALLLRLLGVQRDDVVSDYLLTVEAERDIAARLSRAPGHERRAELPREFFTVPVEAIVGVLDVWDAHGSGTHGWYVEAGGSDADVERLRARLLQ